MLNVFEDQRFLLRRSGPDDPVGGRVTRSFRELMTMPEEPGIRLRFDYPLEYMNMAALGLCAALAQTAFEPEGAGELADRLRAPMSDEDFERGIAPLRDLFTIDGASGTRFLQGPEPPRDKKGRLDSGPLADLLLTVKKGDKSFLNRPDDAWAVRLDQIPLLLFSRATYYEKSAGRGYLTGTSGDLELRVYPIDRDSLRRTIWLNVLCAAHQPDAEFIAAGSTGDAGDGEGYDGWMWHTPPPDDVAKGMTSLRSGLLWMVANAYIEIRELEEPRCCIVTGEPVEGRAGVSVVVTATGRGYGRKVQREKGPEVRDSFFLHPNGPSQMRGVKEGTHYKAHMSVAENSGIVGQMAGLFFASNEGDYRMAPVIKQLYALLSVNQRRRQPMPGLDLLCFGFHMLSSKKNIHGGYEHEEFHYPIIGIDEQDAWDVLSAAHDIMAAGARLAQGIDRALAEAVQICMLVQTETKTEKDNRTIAFKTRSALSPGDIIPALSREYWDRLGVELRKMIEMIGEAGGTREDLNDARDEIMEHWRGCAASHARELFNRIFSDYITSPSHFLSAYKARQLFHARLRDMGVTFGVAGGARPSQPTTMETTP